MTRVHVFMKLTENNIAKKIFNTLLIVVLILSLSFSSAIITSSLNSKKAFAYQTVKTYSWKTIIDANINTDSSISVTEQKVIDITKFIEKAKKYKPESNYKENTTITLSPLVWNFNGFPENTNLTLSDAKIGILSNQDSVLGNWNSFTQGTFLAKWHGDDGPSTSMMTYDQKQKQLCLFSELTNSDQYSEKQAYDIVCSMTGNSDTSTWNFTKAVIYLNYTIECAAMIYKDVADFEWIYVSDSWLMDSYDVSLNVTIPIGSSSIANPLGKITSLEQNNESTTERNIYAWGHGSSSGIVDLNPNGTVNINNKIVPGSTDAEVRIVFPSSWLSNLNPKSNIAQQNQSKLTTILKEESVWRDFRTDAVNKILLPIIFVAICIIILVVVLAICISYRRRFSEEIITNQNLKDLHPCLLVRLKNWNHEHSHDIVVSLLHLNEDKKIKITRMPSGDFEIRLKNAKYAKNPYASRSLDIIDKRSINFLFSMIACGNPLLHLSDIYNYANARSYEFLTNYLAWHSLLTDQVNQLAKFKSLYDKIRHILFGTAIVLCLISIFLGIFFLEIITPIVGVACSFVIAIVGNSMRNKIYFKNKQGKKINAVDLNIGLAEYTDLIDQFRIKATKTIHDSVLCSQDNWGRFLWQTR